MKLHKKESIECARELHLQAVVGMEQVHGKDHLNTLIARENICCVAVQSGDLAHLKEAHKMMLEVFETRKQKLGREHAYILLAMINLALVEVGLGNLEGAEELIQLGLPVAQRNLGADHVACLWANYHLGKIWVHQGLWEKAETLLVDIAERQRNVLQGRGQ